MSVAPPPAHRGLASVETPKSSRNQDHLRPLALEWRRNAYTRCIQATAWAALLLRGNAEIFLNFQHLTPSQRFYCPNHDDSTRSKNIAPFRGKSRSRPSTRQCPRRYFHIGRWLQNQNNRQSEQPSQERASKVVLESGPWFCCPVANSDERHLTESVAVVPTVHRLSICLPVLGWAVANKPDRR